MEKYWKNNKPQAPPEVLPTDVTNANGDAGTALSEYDRYRQTLVNNRDREGWQAELRHYESDMPADVPRRLIL